MSNQILNPSELLSGWVTFKWGCKGRSTHIHYLNKSFVSLCGHWKTTIDDQSKLQVLENPRINKICQKCLHILNIDSNSRRITK